MAVANDYVTGTITLTNGSSTFTGTGTAWRLAGFRDGDRIYVDNLVAIIAPNSVTDPLIDSNTSGKLTRPWTGTTGTRTYRMSYKPDGARVTAETRNLIEMLGNGNVSALAGLTSGADLLPYFDGIGTMATTPFTAAGRSLIGATNAGDARAAIAAVAWLADRAALKVLDTTKETVAFIRENGREGFFEWSTGDFSSRIANDPLEGIFIKASAVAATSGAWVRILYNNEISPQMMGAGLGADDTAIFTSFIAFAAAYSTTYTVVLYGTYNASKISFSGANNMVVRSDNAFITANSAAAQTCLVEIKIPNFNHSGRLVAIGGYRTNYQCGFHIWHETALQNCLFNSLVANSFVIGSRIGNLAYPSALISENSFINPQTYGCPVAMEVIGGETYISISNPQLSADSFGGNTAWQALEKVAVRNRGATVVINTGETINTADTNGKIFHFCPIDRGSGRVEWGSLIVNGTIIETAAPLCVIDNLGLTINNSASNRRGMVQFNNCVGYHSQDLSAFIFVPTAYNDFIIINNPNFWKIGAQRTQPNVFCAGGSTAGITMNGYFGPGFAQGLGAIQGGVVNFSRREVLRATGLNGRSFTAASGFEPCLYTTIETAGDKARWSSLYTAGTGIFTIPVGDFNDVIVTASIRMTGVTSGYAILRQNGTEVVRVPMTTGCANISHSLGNLVSGTTLQILVDVDANDTGISQVSANVFSITAKRGEVQ